jgi:geranylgeranyl diphosphate synthase type I
MAAAPSLTRFMAYKKAIDADIATYAKHWLADTHKHYGRFPSEIEVNIFLDILARGGKRIRGSLVMLGYELSGGTDRRMIVQAARAIEMLHAYILIIDDVQDRATLRRGKPSAHKLLAEYHRKHHLRGDADYAGISLALNAALAGAHTAQAILAKLQADPARVLKTIESINQTIMVTAHGQAMDIMNELVNRPDPTDIDKVLEWKTAQYTIINPLHVGMILAGAPQQALDAVRPYALHAGKAFQITDDILGIFGDEKSLGKLPGDDIREGKGTLLTLYVLEHGTAADCKQLEKCLGNPELSDQDFADCKRIIERSGALANAEAQVAAHIADAMQALETVARVWTPEAATFLRELAEALASRLS